MLNPSAHVLTVGIQAHKLSHAACVYSNDSLLSEERLLDEFGFAVPSELESPADFTSEVKEFRVERYGGTGIGRNGGAGRCGSYGQFQIKGIGRTPLIDSAASREDFWHSHGGISLVDTIQEAVWAEVFCKVLPFGATRVAGILTTGTKCWYEGPDGNRTEAPRALLVRQCALRPAHFMRAVHSRAEAALQPASEVSLLKATIIGLPALLPKSRHATPSNSAVALVEGLREMIWRMAYQCAFAQSRRFIHGTLYPSNIALDGRWLDFGTATSLPTYANTKSAGAPRSFSTLWEEQDRIIHIIDELVFYVNKYYPLAAGQSFLSPTYFTELFCGAYDKALRVASLRLLALPSDLFVRCVDAPESVGLAGALVDLMRKNARDRIELASINAQTPARNIVGEVICALSAAECSDSCYEILAEVVPNTALKIRLIDGFTALVDYLERSAASAKVSRRSICIACYLGGLKASKQFPELYRHNLMEDNRRIVRENYLIAELRRAIEEKVRFAAATADLLFSIEAGWSVTAWHDQTSSLRFNLATGCWEWSKAGSGIIDIYSGFQANHVAFDSVEKYYGAFCCAPPWQQSMSN